MDASKFASHVLLVRAHTLISTLYENEFNCQTHKSISNMLLMDATVLGLDDVINYTLLNHSSQIKSTLHPNMCIDEYSR